MRVKLELPKQFIYKTTLTVRIHEINYGQHLGNDSVLSLVHEARLQFLVHFGFSEHAICGLGLVLSDAVVVYKRQALWGDALNIYIAVGDFSKHGCDIYYWLVDANTHQEVARVKTGIVIFDYEKKKIARLPAPFKTTLTQAAVLDRVEKCSTS